MKNKPTTTLLDETGTTPTYFVTDEIGQSATTSEYNAPWKVKPFTITTPHPDSDKAPVIAASKPETK